MLSRTEVASPAVLSRHVLIPPHAKGDPEALPLHAPDFRAMLFEILKGEELVAVVRLGPTWFGLVCPYTEVGAAWPFGPGSPGCSVWDCGLMGGLALSLAVVLPTPAPAPGARRERGPT